LDLRLNFWSLKRAKRPKEGRIVSWRLLLVRRGALKLWRWDFVHEVKERRPLATGTGSLEQHPFIIYWRDFRVEEGAWV
jgi:hypothetical protein